MPGRHPGLRAAALTVMMVAPLASSPAAAQLRVSVEESPFAEEVAAGLARELPEATVLRQATDASLSVVVAPDGEELAVGVTARAGEVLLSRRIPLDPTAPQPAVRVAILLSAQTARAYVEAPSDVTDPDRAPTPAASPGPADPPAETPPGPNDQPTAAPARTPPTAAAPADTAPADTAPTGAATAPVRRRGVLSAGFTVGGWLRPAAPLVGFLGGLGVRFDRLTASARAEIAGLVCCRLSDARFDGDALEASFLAEARVHLVRWGPIDLSVAIAAGAAYVRLQGRPDDDPTFPVSLAEQTRSTWDPQARVALGVEWPLWQDGLALGVWAGVQLRAARLVVDLPARDGAPPPVDAGPVMPWGALTASLPIF